MDSDRISLNFFTPLDYEEGGEHYTHNLFDALWYYFNTINGGQKLYYRWLSEGETTITLVKGIHNTSWDRRLHFTIRVGTTAYHAYLNTEPMRYTVKSEFTGKTGKVNKPIILFITEAHLSSSPLSNNFFKKKKKTSKKKTECKGRIAHRERYQVSRPPTMLKSSILALLNIE